MTTIYKYPVPLTNGGLNTVLMPLGAKILALQMQARPTETSEPGWEDVPTLWALVNPVNPSAPRHFKWYGTGAKMDERLHEYIGTVQIDARLVFHLFEV